MDLVCTGRQVLSPEKQRLLFTCHDCGLGLELIETPLGLRRSDF
jgi:hypothetical protein